MVFNKLEDFIEFQLDLFIKLKVPTKVLRTKEKEVYIQFIICDIEGVDVNTREANALVRDRVGFKYDIDVLQYKSKLYKKGWFKKDKYGNYSLIPNFNFSEVKKFTSTKSYNFTIEYKEKKDKE